MFKRISDESCDLQIFFSVSSKFFYGTFFFYFVDFAVHLYSVSKMCHVPYCNHISGVLISWIINDLRLAFWFRCFQIVNWSTERWKLSSFVANMKSFVTYKCQCKMDLTLWRAVCVEQLVKAVGWSVLYSL